MSHDADMYDKTAPNNLINLFKHHYKTRSALNHCFYTETITTEKKKRSFVIVGSKIWDGLSVSISKEPKQISF